MFYAFDLLYHNGTDLRSTAQLQRKVELKTLTDMLEHPVHFSEHFATDGNEVFAYTCKLGWKVSSQRMLMRLTDLIATKVGSRSTFRGVAPRQLLQRSDTETARAAR